MSTSLVSIREQIKAQLERQKKAVQPVAGRISTSGRMFTMPTGTKSPGPLECIILDFRNTNWYYPGVYKQGQPNELVCHASAYEIESMAPTKASQPQAESCSTCPKNQWGSSSTGGKGKDCANRVTLAVVPRNPTRNTEVMLIDGSATSLKSWGSYLSKLTETGMTPMAVGSVISFNEGVTYAQLKYEAVEPLGEDELIIAAGLYGEAQTLLNAI